MRLFAHRLAIQLGCADVSGLLAQLPQGAWLEWIAYFEREPWGELRADTRQAITSAVVYNVNRGKGQPARNVTDFMAHRPTRAESTAGNLAALKAHLRSMGASHADID